MDSYQHRKTRKMQRVQDEQGEILETLLPRMVTERGLSATADHLKVSKATLGYWLLKLNIQVKRVALAPGERLEIVRDGEVPKRGTEFLTREEANYLIQSEEAHKSMGRAEKSQLYSEMYGGEGRGLGDIIYPDSKDAPSNLPNFRDVGLRTAAKIRGEDDPDSTPSEAHPSPDPGDADRADPDSHPAQDKS